MKIGILTSFSGMVNYYSLTSVVMTQIKMIHAAGHTPVLMAQEDFTWPEKPEWCEVRRPIPTHTKIDYAKSEDITEEHRALVMIMEENFVREALDLDAIFTHDLIFTGWHMPIGFAVRRAARKCGPWFHWVHSVPGTVKVGDDVKPGRDYWILPDNSWLVYPNATDKVQCAECFRTWPEKVLVIPHCCDVRDLHFKTAAAEKLVTNYDVLGAELVQVYPIPTDRAEAKGIMDVISMFGCLKRLGRSVRLVVPNAWCNVDHLRKKVAGLKLFSHTQGLDGRDVIFTSQVLPEFEVGVPTDVISDLMMCANLFICPTQSETFGLSLAEAALSGSLLVLNKDLPMMTEVCGGAGNAIWAKFSSSFQNTIHVDKDKYFCDIGKIILHAFHSSPELRSRTHYRINYRREAVWSALEQAILANRLVDSA